MPRGAALRQSRWQIGHRERTQLDLHGTAALRVEVLDRVEVVVRAFDAEPEAEHLVHGRARCGIHRKAATSLQRRSVRCNTQGGECAEFDLGAVDAACELERRMHALHFILVGGRWWVV